jgi:hypothetical protein
MSTSVSAILFSSLERLLQTQEETLNLHMTPTDFPRLLRDSAPDEVCWPDLVCGSIVLLILLQTTST